MTDSPASRTSATLERCKLHSHAGAWERGGNGMSEHFIKNIEITTFKCFDHFEASGFKRVNLIGGKNNIGKTALLEAINMNIESYSIKSFVYSIVRINNARKNSIDLPPKEQIEDALDSLDHFSSCINNNNTIIYFSEEKDLEVNYRFSINGVKKEISKNKITYSGKRIIPYPKNTLLYPLRTKESVLFLLYQTIQEEDRENELNRYLTKFDKELRQFKFINKKPKIKKHGKYQDLNTFGDGLKAYISIILAIYHCKNGHLFIDELENGIHYTQFDQLWEIILTASKQANCQIFTTTHSRECIDSYARTAKKLADEDISFITLVNNRENKIEAINYRYETLQNSLSQDHEVRGW
jgi:AAA15 family ATPase/GTPase